MGGKCGPPTDHRFVALLESRSSDRVFVKKKKKKIEKTPSVCASFALGETFLKKNDRDCECRLSP